MTSKQQEEMPLSRNSRIIAINTIALNIKFIFNIVIVFFTTRIALNTLGEVDFGLFSLITGVIMMLSFLSSALSLSTQRFLAIAVGKNDPQKTSMVFNTSLFFHIALAGGLYLIAIAAQPLLFNGFLNISPDRIESSIQTYHFVVVTMIVIILAIPFDAIINAKEDIWFLSIADVIISALRLASAIAITLIVNESNGNLLVDYSFLILLATIIGFGIKGLWVFIKYKEIDIKIRKFFNREQMSEQIKFTGWNTLGTFATACRGQGTAVVMNVFFGAGVNAAYGIANQLNSIATIFASTLTTAVAPQVMKGFGAGERERVLALAISYTKFALFASIAIGLPIVIENKTILSLWLKNVPPYTSIFCNLIIFLFWIMQTCSGLVTCIIAKGNIKNYQITISILLLSPLIIGYWIFKYFSLEPQFIIYLLLVAQVATMFATLYFAKKNVGLDIKHYLIHSVFKPFFAILICYLAGKYFIHIWEPGIIRLLTIGIFEVTLLSFLYYKFIFDNDERRIIKTMFNRLLSRLK